MLSGGSGIGLLARYFPSTDYTGALWKRIDPQVSFDFGGGSPESRIIPNDFSVKRTGQVQAYFSETYKFEVVTRSDNVSLTVGGANGDIARQRGDDGGRAHPDRARRSQRQRQLERAALLEQPVHALMPWCRRRSSTCQRRNHPHGATRRLLRKQQLHCDAYRARLEPDIASNLRITLTSPRYRRRQLDRQVGRAHRGAVYRINQAVRRLEDDAVTTTLDGAAVPSLTSPPTGTFTACSGSMTWNAGELHTLHLEHHRGQRRRAKLILSWLGMPA